MDSAFAENAIIHESAIFSMLEKYYSNEIIEFLAIIRYSNEILPYA